MLSKLNEGRRKMRKFKILKIINQKNAWKIENGKYVWR